jgi:hypothetical protein
MELGESLMISIGVTNESTVISDTDVQDCITAMQIQHDSDFKPAWKTEVLLTFYAKGNVLPPGTWQLVILDDSDQAGALGYHDTTVNGDPMGKIFAKDDLKDGASWTVTLSHEFHEMIIDPYICLLVQVGDIFYSYESDDAVEDDSFAKPVKIPNGKSILISDSVTPAWFIPGDSSGKYDLYGHVSKPFELLAGGYIGVLDPKTGWTQLNARLSTLHSARKAKISEGHRRYLRLRKTRIKSTR